MLAKFAAAFALLPQYYVYFKMAFCMLAKFAAEYYEYS